MTSSAIVCRQEARSSVSIGRQVCSGNRCSKEILEDGGRAPPRRSDRRRGSDRSTLTASVSEPLSPTGRTTITGRLLASRAAWACRATPSPSSVMTTSPPSPRPCAGLMVHPRCPVRNAGAHARPPGIRHRMKPRVVRASPRRRSRGPMWCPAHLCVRDERSYRGDDVPDCLDHFHALHHGRALRPGQAGGALEGAKDLHPLDRVDTEVSSQFEIRVEEVHGMAHNTPISSDSPSPA